MNLYEFEMLTDNEQVDLLYKEGVYLGKRKVGEYSVVLYQVDNFYIEILYKKYRYYISRIRCFTSVKLLDPYLSQIDIVELINPNVKS
jgi:hypothetical protein